MSVWRAWGAVLVTLSALNPLAAQAPPDPPPELAAFLVVLAGRLNIREAPALDAPVVATASRGDRLCAVRYQGDWAEVRTPHDRRGPAGRASGFVSRGFVSETRASPAQLAEMGCR